jgi:putative membrane-bound dehydrogenase-like protein
MPRWPLCFPVLVALAAPAAGQLPPDKALAALKPADGLQVELFAAEPMVLNPTSIDVDHLGRVWVCEAVNYRRTNFNRPIIRPEGDRIVVLADKDGDGKADDSTVFYQGKDMYGPLGVAVAKDAAGPGWQVYVCQSPDVLLFTDKDGDGKADGPPQKFLSGIKGFDHDHGVHGINIGPDGKLYFTIGDAGVDGLQSTDGQGRKWKSNTTDCRAGTVWRCDRDGKNLELIAHNFRNNYECCVNSFGEIWLSDNDDDGNQQTRICFVMPGGDYGYHPRGPGQSHWHEEQPGVVHKALRTGFGSPTGICFYEGSLLPEKYRGQLLHTDAGPRELRCFHIAPKGAGYELTQGNLLTSTDNWFRPSDVCVAPDGSLMVADWYDPGVGGHGMGDTTRGRVYRVTSKGHKGYAVPAVKLDTTEGMFAALGSPCLAVRALAHDKLRSQGTVERASTLLAAMPEKNPNLRGRATLFGPMFPTDQDITPQVAERVGSMFSRLLMAADSASGSVLSCRWAMKSGLAAEMLNDGFYERHSRSKDPAVNRELALLLQQCDAAFASSWFYKLAKLYDGKDHFYRAALNIACGTDPARRDAVLADFDTHFPDWDDKVADLVWELRGPRLSWPSSRPGSPTRN